MQFKNSTNENRPTEQINIAHAHIAWHLLYHPLASGSNKDKTQYNLLFLPTRKLG